MSQPAIASRRFATTVSNVRTLYESDVLIDTFNRGFAGRWHTPVFPDIPGIVDSDHYVCHLARIGCDHRVLDFGSGVGVTSCGIARIAGCQVRGLNISIKQVRLAIEYAKEVGLGARVSFDHYGGRRFPYGARSFDRAVF